MNYSEICDHTRLKRINNDFVRCLKCGQSIVNQNKVPVNKSRKEFADENKSFIRNFDRNFSNVLPEMDEQSTRNSYQYYMDRKMMNKIIINRAVKNYSDPQRYTVTINGHNNYLTDEEIKKLLLDINAVRVDADLVKN